MDPNFNYKNFKPQAPKIKTSKGSSIARYALSGLAFVLIDKASEKLFESPQNNNSINFNKYYEKNQLLQQKQLQQNQEQHHENNQQQQTQNTVKYSREHLRQKIQQKDDPQNQNDNNQIVKPFSSRDTMIQNFFYGFFFSHLGSIFNQKFHLQLLKFKIPPYSKILLLTPFAMLPYYYMMGMSDQLQIDDINNKVKQDFFALWTIRAFGDYLAYFKIPYIKAGNVSPSMASLDKLGQMSGNAKGLLIGHKILRGLFIFSMISLYNERIMPKTVSLSEQENQQVEQDQQEIEIQQQQIQKQQNEDSNKKNSNKQ